MSAPELSTCPRWAAREARLECARVVEACTDIVSPETARKLATRIRALNEPNVARTLALSLVETRAPEVEAELSGE